jgi:hypothetical protein
MMPDQQGGAAGLGFNAGGGAVVVDDSVAAPSPSSPPPSPTPTEPARAAYSRLVYVDEECGLRAIERITQLLRSGGVEPPRIYRARGCTTLTRREILGDREIAR